jgi:hypothetical protein
MSILRRNAISRMSELGAIWDESTHIWLDLGVVSEVRGLLPLMARNLGSDFPGPTIDDEGSRLANMLSLQ